MQLLFSPALSPAGSRGHDIHLGRVAELPEQLLAVLPRQTESAHVGHTESRHDARHHSRFLLRKFPLHQGSRSEASCGATGSPAARFSPCATVHPSGIPSWPALARTTQEGSSRVPPPVAAESDVSPPAPAHSTPPLLSHAGNQLDIITHHVTMFCDQDVQMCRYQGFGRRRASQAIREHRNRGAAEVAATGDRGPTGRSPGATRKSIGSAERRTRRAT